jgi:hypothetical protein
MAALEMGVFSGMFREKKLDTFAPVGGVVECLLASLTSANVSPNPSLITIGKKVSAVRAPRSVTHSGGDTVSVVIGIFCLWFEGSLAKSLGLRAF